MALTYSVTLMGMFQWGVRQSAEVENMVGPHVGPRVFPQCVDIELCSAENSPVFR